MAQINGPSLHNFFEDLYLFVRFVRLPRMSAPDVGRWFERRVANYFNSDKRYDVLGVTSDMNLVPTSGIRHEFDLLIERGTFLFLFECKCTKSVKHNDLLLFQEKSFDYWLRLFEVDDGRRLFRVFVTKSAPDDAAREFAYMWNIILVEPSLMPVPQIISLLSDNAVCHAVNIQRPDQQVAVLGKVCRSMDQLFVRSASNRRHLTLDLTDLVYHKNPRLDSYKVRLVQRSLSQLFSQYIARCNPEYTQQRAAGLQERFRCSIEG